MTSATAVGVTPRTSMATQPRLYADAIVRILARRYEAAHHERSRCILWLESMASADAAPPGPATNRGEVVLKESFFPVESPGLAPGATASQRHAHVRDFARAWLDLIPFTHTIYVAEPWEEDLGDLVTVRIYRDDAAEHRIHEDDAAAAIARRYGERYPAESAAIVLLADYCK